MCGILFGFSKWKYVHEMKSWQELVKKIAKRGPDAQEKKYIKSKDDAHFLSFYSSVLNLRGEKVTRQPFVKLYDPSFLHTTIKTGTAIRNNFNESNEKITSFNSSLSSSTSDDRQQTTHIDSILCFNGEIYSGLEIDINQNDGQVLFNELSLCQTHPEIMTVLNQIKGEWALVFYHSPSSRIYFGRDVLGRRSLLWRFDHQDQFWLSSLGVPSALMDTYIAKAPSEYYQDNTWKEVPTTGIHYFSVLRHQEDKTEIEYALYHWDNVIKTVYWESLSLISKEEEEPPQSIDLSGHLIKPFDKLNTELIYENEPEQLDKFVHEEVDRFIKVLSDSVRVRCESIPDLPSCQTTKQTSILIEHLKINNDTLQEEKSSSASLQYENNSIQLNADSARLAVLFSGGLDCACIAALASQYIPKSEPIDLINVAFENPRIMKANQKDSLFDIYESCPDRITARQGFKELQEEFPAREWRLVLVNVPYTEFVLWRDHVVELAAPSDTLMDLSIAVAFWFASRGRGKVITSKPLSNSLSPLLTSESSPTSSISHDENETYTSQARVLFSGLGADEQLGGYSRHHVQFKQFGWTGFVQELQKDVDRISTRNLGRDDRIMADHGKEVRYPYLDECILTYLSDLPVNVKANPALPKGEGDKRILRLVAQKLGLKKTSLEEKRAVQFGARTAKMDHGKQKGTDVL